MIDEHGKIRWKRLSIYVLPWVCFALATIYGMWNHANNIKIIIEQHRSITLLQDRLEKNTLWMTEIQKLANDYASAHWDRHQENATWNQLFESNPTLVRPPNFIPDKQTRTQFSVPEMPNPDAPPADRHLLSPPDPPAMDHHPEHPPLLR